VVDALAVDSLGEGLGVARNDSDVEMAPGLVGQSEAGGDGLEGDVSERALAEVGDDEHVAHDEFTPSSRSVSASCSAAVSVSSPKSSMSDSFSGSVILFSVSELSAVASSRSRSVSESTSKDLRRARRILRIWRTAIR